MQPIDPNTNDPDDAARERARLLRLCTRLTGNRDVAEDCVQETLLEAWRHAHKLHDPTARPRWLAAIARNVCRRWTRSQWNVDAPTVQLNADEDIRDTYSVEVEVERRELVARLRRALGLLPPVTCHVFVARYLYAASYATIAAELHMSEDAVAMRLVRGKHVLRRLLATDLQRATASSMQDGTTRAWQDTRIWCPQCGQHRLAVCLPPPPGTVAFRCLGCSSTPNETHFEYPLANASFVRIVGNLRRPRAIMSRTAAWGHTYFRSALAHRAAHCTHCGQPAGVHVPHHTHAGMDGMSPHVVYIVCAACATTTCISLAGLITNLPDVQQFWRTHCRMRTLPAYEVEAAGQPALVTRIERVTGAERITVVTARDTFAVLSIHPAG